MSYLRSTTVDPSSGGDTVKEAILDLDTDLTNIFTYLNEHEALTTGAHGITSTIVGTNETQTLVNKTLTAPDINGGTADDLTSLTVANDTDMGDWQIRAKQFYADIPIGTAPLVVDSTTLVNNLNVQYHGGRTAPSTAIVGVGDTQTLTDKTLTSPTINQGTINTATLVLKQSAAPTPTAEGEIWWDTDDLIVVGDGAGQKIFSPDNVTSGIHGVTGDIVGTTDTQTLSAKTLTSPVLNTGVSGTAVKDEDDMASDSATHLCTQQSIKKYVDDSIGTGAGLPTVDHTANGDILSVTVDVNAFGFGATLFMASDGNFETADANVLAKMPCVALALESGTGTKDVLIRGYVRDDTWDFTPGGLIYVSGTLGGLTQTAPSSSGDQVQVIGWAYSADIMVFDPSLVLVEV